MADDSYRNSFTVTPHDTNPVAHSTRAIWVGGAGNVTCRLEGDAADRVFSAVAAGTRLPIRVTHIRSTGTTATLMVGLY